MKKTVLASVLLVGALTAQAIPARRGTMAMTQPDGSVVEVELRGDERGHIYVTPEGLPLSLGADGYFNAAIVGEDGRLVDSGIRAFGKEGVRAWGDLAPAVARKAVDSHLKALRDASPVRRATLSRARRAVSADHRGLFPGATFPVKGEQKALVVLIEFADKSFTLDDPHDYFSAMLNEPGFSQLGGTGSAVDYFVENSLGQFVPEFDVYGPVKLEKKSAYYADRTGVEKVYEAVIEACRALDSEVDFTEYDRGGDGYIDNVFLFYAGLGQNAGGGKASIWPHAWYISEMTDEAVKLDGVRLDSYGCTNEMIDKTDPDGVGTFIHEFSHIMGLPDLYTTGYTSAFTPDAYSALDYGPYNNDGRTPPYYGAFERYALDWLQPLELDGPATVSLEPVNTNHAAIVTTATDNEFFLFENRQQQGWDTYIPGHGMLVWHVAYKEYDWTNNTVNNNPDKQLVDIEEADNIRSEGTRDADPFPGTRGVTSFTDDTKPSMKSWAGKGQNKPITDIEEADGIIGFNVCGGAEVEIPATPVPLPVTDITENGALLAWTAVDDADHYVVYVESEGNRIVRDVYATTYALSGLQPATEYRWAVCSSTATWQYSEPSAYTAFTTLGEGALETVGADSASGGEVRWYSLQGRRVLHPVGGRVYIRVEGAKAMKIRL